MAIVRHSKTEQCEDPKEDPKSPLYYRNLKDTNCVTTLSRLFEKLDSSVKVSACLGVIPGSETTLDTKDQDHHRLGDHHHHHDHRRQNSPRNHRQEGLSFEYMTRVHCNLSSSKIWERHTDWTTEVEYTIPHPDGDVTAFDTSSSADARLWRKMSTLHFYAHCGPFNVSLERFTEEPLDKMDMNTSRFSFVKITNTKRFFYETKRSSWVFKLVVLWEGATKAETEKSEKKYLVYVESGSRMTQLSTDTEYTTASLLDKVIDMLSIGHGERRALEFIK